ncbi:hypothetical protein M409DRAFT_49948 [Zasmidium cellare ATCC 36951]|uniref:Zn(2)-C6 fungal-type domain-containing protein n=1 Tax=Zasmidium cellare ATCC 36951 TaxID=1080233 RepID=A0A6A6CYG2_ZASCE|nr:uncharacterized protein M409DRAFT_49948 [Zasmidium cellare ATCC 36951]KAF2172224.1 hypothetical protein M409DRAFT_49948 [Zasmidium cellare ATCC 36951]
MSASRCASPFSLLNPTAHSSPYQCDPEFVPHWYLNDDLMHDCPFNIKTCQGCDGSHSDCVSEDGVDQRSEASTSSSRTGVALSYMRSATPSSSIVSFNSSAACRIQLKEEFLRLYFPAGISHNDTDFMFSKFLCRDMLEDKGTASRLAIDALAFIQIGTAQRDERLVHEAHSRYQAAVRSLNTDLADPGAMYNDGVLSAAYILGFCEVFKPLCPTGRPWQAHHRGLQDLLVARGPDGEYSRFAQLFLYNFRHVAANAGNSARRKVPIAGKDWKRCSAITDAFMATLSDHIITLPEALQRADAAIKRANPSALYDSIMELASYERSMQAWLVRWYSSFEKLPYHHENAEKYPHLQKHTQGAPQAFPKVLRFPTFSHASAQSVYWIALLQIKQTLYEVNQGFKLPILPKAEAILVAEANDIAEKLCQSVGWFAQPRFGFCGVLSSRGALHYACKWYSRRMELQKIAWCQKVAKSLERQNSMGDIYQRSYPQSRNREQKEEDDDAEFEEDDQPDTPP